MPSIIHFTVNITCFYTFAHFTLVWVLKHAYQIWWRFPLGLGITMFIFILLKYMLDYALHLYHPTEYQLVRVNLQSFSGFVYRGIYFLLFATGYYYLLQYIQERNIKEEVLLNYFNKTIHIEREAKDKAHRLIDVMRSQLNMHYLFSSMNCIYSETKTNSPKIAEMVAATADLMHYYNDYASTQGITMEKEISQLKNLIKMDQLRYPDREMIELTVHENIKHINQPTYVLVPLMLLLLKFVIPNKGETRGSLLIYHQEDKLIVSGKDFQHIADALKLQEELENFKTKMSIDYSKPASFIYLLNEGILNFDFAFENILDDYDEDNELI